MTLDINFDLMQWQLDFLQSPARIKALSGASDTGKSWICRFALIAACLQYPHSFHFATATTWTQTYRAIAEPIMEFLNEYSVEFDFRLSSGKKALNLCDVARARKGDGMIEFINGSRIELYSSDALNARIRSREFSMGFLEEATLIEEKYIELIFFEAIRRLRQPNTPHHLLLATNPDIKTSWLYQHIFDPVGRKASESRIQGILEKSGYEKNEAYDFSRIETRQLCFRDGYNRDDREREALILMGTPRQIDLFYHGKWGNLEGVAYILEAGKHICDIDTSELDKFYISFDYGFSPDPMVYLLTTVKNGTILVVDEIVLYSQPVNKHSGYLDNWMRQYNIVGYTGETATGAGEIRDLLSSYYKLHYYATVKKRTVGWTFLADLVDVGRLKINEHCINTINSLSGLTWVSGIRGVDVEGVLDDPADALRYFAMCPIIYDQCETYRRRK